MQNYSQGAMHLRSLRSGRAWRTSALAAGTTLFLATATFAASPAPTDTFVAHTLASCPASGWSSVIVKVREALTASEEAQITRLGGDITRRLSLIQSVSVRVPSRNLSKLASLPFVSHLSQDSAVQKCDEFTNASSEADMAAAQYGLTGKGVTVAVIDSGVSPVQDLYQPASGLLKTPTSRVVAAVNLSTAISKGATTLSLGGSGLGLSSGTGGVGLGAGGLTLSGSSNGNSYDPCGHGTHVAGIIAGNGAASTGANCFHHFTGIAPGASLVDVRVLDGYGQSNVSTVISGVQWVVQNKSKYSIRIINLSLGHPVGESYQTDPLCQAVEAAWKAGIVVVCAAGNEGRANTSATLGAANEGYGTAYGSIQSPANDPLVITVGATKSTDGSRVDDHIATYSSRGPSRLDLILKPDIIAPGNKVISLDAGGSALDTYAGGTNQISQSTYKHPLLGDKPSGDYFRLSGTSMAAPVVAGAAALLLQANSKLSPDTIKARLMLSADKWADPGGNADALTYGAGYVNIPAAVACTASVPSNQTAASPALVVDSAGHIGLADSGVWGCHAVWGSTAVWGSAAVWGSHAVWGSSVAADHAVWGSTFSALAADHAVWGSSVWSDHAVWGSAGTAADLSATAISGER